MGKPLPYYVFILGLLLVFSAMGGIMYFSYRKCAKLRDIVRFVVAPDEECPADYRLSSIVSSFLWFLLIHISFTVIYHFIDMAMSGGETAANSISGAQSSFPIWLLLFVPPLIEESAFRLPLKRRRGFTAISAFAFVFLISSAFSPGSVYDVTWQRLVVSAVAAIAVWLWGYGWIREMDFRVWFWLMAVFFSALHLMNYGMQPGLSEWVRLSIKELVRIPGALVLGYIRLKHGFFSCLAIHIANNLFAFLMT